MGEYIFTYIQEYITKIFLKYLLKKTWKPVNSTALDNEDSNLLNSKPWVGWVHIRFYREKLKCYMVLHICKLFDIA